jgi:RNA polymerase-binding transcription factor DksA
MATKKNTKKAAPKKAAAKKKPAAKKPVKKAAPKKAAAKKAVKKVVAKKVVAKKPLKKAPSKKAVKKVAPKKKVVAKKVAPKKKVVAKKVAPKKIAKPVAKSAPKVAEKKSVKPSAPIKPVMKMATKKEEKPIEVKAPKTPEPKKPELKMATSKPAKRESSAKKTPFSAPIDIKSFANMSKSFKIPVAKPNVIKQAHPAVVDSRSRYSDAELLEFKEIINGKLAEARKDLELLRGSLSHTDDHGTDDTSPSFKMMEDGSETLSREETAQLAGRQEKFIMALENALIRINNKTYGICRVTGKLISKDRLKLVPHTTLSIEAKNMQD